MSLFTNVFLKRSVLILKRSMLIFKRSVLILKSSVLILKHSVLPPLCNFLEHSSGLVHTMQKKFEKATITSYSSLWKRVLAWERSRAASAYGIIWGDAGQNKHGEI